MSGRVWHCYLGAYESVYAQDVIADSAEQAALLAATATRLAGDWTVVEGTPATVTVTEVQAFQAKDGQR